MREDDPSFVVHCVMRARSGNIGHDLSTKERISSIGSIPPFSIIDWIIEELSIDFIAFVISNEGLIESNMI